MTFELLVLKEEFRLMAVNYEDYATVMGDE